MSRAVATEASPDLQRSNLTRSQFMIWSGQQMRPTVPLYNMAFRYDLDGALNEEAFARAWQMMLDRCDALRTVFRERGGIPNQVVLDVIEAPMAFVDMTELEDPDGGANAWIDERCRRTFDLLHCCVDTALLRLGPQRHTWFINQHHSTMDAWSSALIFRGMSQCYVAALEGADAPDLDLLPFADYVEYERSLRGSESQRTAESYWDGIAGRQTARARLYGRVAQGESCTTHRHACALGALRSQGLRELASMSGFRALSADLAMFNLLATLVAAYLWRVSGEPLQVIGTPAHNRSSLAFRNTIGLFIEFFPLSVELVDDETFRSLHGKVAEASQAYLRHAVPGSSSSASVRSFNVVLNYIPVSFGDFSGIPCETTWLHAGSAEPDHELRIQVHDFGDSGELTIDFDCNAAVFPPALREKAPLHLLALVDALLREPDTAVASVPMAVPDERHALLSDFNHLLDRAPPGETVVGLFRRQALRRAGAVAVSDRAQRLTYAELDLASDHLASRLRENGAAGGSLVGIFLERSIELVITVLGVVKAGGAFVPLESRLPVQRIEFILKDTGACLVITREALRARLPDFAEVFDIGAVSGAAGVDVTVEAPAPTQPAYVIYTSGSTGEPKGVVVEHSALTDYADWAHRTFSDVPHPAYPLYSSIGFDLTITSLFVPLISGGSIVVYPEDDAPTDLSILRVFDEDCVDVVKLTPAHLRLVAGRNLRDTRIGTLILGGEDLKTSLARRVNDASGGLIRVFNEYGPTECVVACMVHAYDPAVDCGPSVPIGRPADGNRIYLLDQGLNPVPTGVGGEIFIGGRLASGYLGRPALTAERFIDDPFQPVGRVYRTGDLGRLREDGVLEYLGRNDEQVKVRGVRIEPAEVELALAQHPDVDVCVLGVAASARKQTSDDLRYCTRCGIASNYPGADIDASGVCKLCIDFDRYRERAQAYFHDMDDLCALFDAAPGRRRGHYDCLMLLSGGKDSTYALYQIATMTERVLAVTLDNGYISDGAKANISRVVDGLGIDHRYLRTDVMNAIFVDSLERHSNVCHGCFKTLYTLAVHTALDEGIPLIVTGLSRGQFFETRLTPEQFIDGRFDVEAIDQTVLEARKAYHRIDDAVSQLLDVSVFTDERVFQEVRFVDFYRYCDVSLDAMYTFLAEHAPWIRPADTGRSTNCLINDAGIYVHKNKQGFHNYALPYSWDVRLGHKQRDAALDELNDSIDRERVHAILHEIGYDEPIGLGEPTEDRLIAYVTSGKPLDGLALRTFLAERLPPGMVPSEFVHLDRIPLTANGKVDRAALPVERLGGPSVNDIYRTPETPLQIQLAGIWREVLRVQRVGLDDNFFDLGGDSIGAIQIVARANDAGLAVTVQQLFEHQSVDELARSVGTQKSVQAVPNAAAAVVDDPELTLADLDDAGLDKLAALLKRN